MASEGIGSAVDAVLGLLFAYRWIVGTVVAAYLDATYQFWRLARDAGETPTLAPISVKGGITQEFGARQVGLVIRTHLFAISDTFQKVTQTDASLYTADAVIREFRDVIDQVRASIQLNPAEYPLDYPEYKVKEDLVVKVGTLEVPVGAVVNLFLFLLRVLPVPYRRRYEASLIRLSLVSIGPETQVLVYQEKKRETQPSPPEVSKRDRASTADVLSKTAAVGNLTDLSNLLWDAAFMILEFDGRVFKGRNWLGMRWFVDGLVSVDEYRRTGKRECMSKAKQSFCHAAESDPDNYEALYVYGSMLAAELEQESNDKAVRVFTRALRTDKHKLRALIHSGLAYCYFQQFHRLAKRDPDVLATAKEHAEKARVQWRAAVGSDRLHPLILLSLALVQHADEGSGETRDDMKKRFVAAVPLYLEGIEIEPDNWRFYNNLGWVLTKLAEWGVEDVEPGVRLPQNVSPNAADAAEWFLQHALSLNPANRLTYANMCLLYATPRFRREREKYLDRCRYYGLAAVRLDPTYINGYRDLCLSLLRYGELDEAYEQFKEALRLASTVEKDQEIIADAVSALENLRVSESELERWRHPDPKLLKPPDLIQQA